MDSSTSTSYGKACRTCSRAKCKCLYRDNETSCERCLRLKKDCQPSISVRKRQVENKSNTKQNHLEDKVDELGSLLRPQAVGEQAQQVTPPISYHYPSPNVETLLQEPDAGSILPSNVIIDTTTGFPTFVRPSSATTALRSSFGTSRSPITNYLFMYQILDVTAEEQLRMFRQSFLPMFSFVHIPVTMSAADLRRERPFLWLLIMSLTTTSVQQQLSMGDTISQIVAQQIVVQHEKSLDLVLGLICYLAWSQYHKKERTSLLTWTQLAVALVFELGIHKEPLGEKAQLYSMALNSTNTFVPQVRTLEERRTLLATYLVSSMVWTAVRKMEPMRWTPYMEDCVRILSEKKETDLDMLLITQVKCHAVKDQVTRSLAEWATEGEIFKTSPAVFVKPMQLQLQSIRKNIPAELQSNAAILLFIYGTEINILEPLLSKTKLSNQSGLPDLQRLEGLNALLTAIERWLSVFDSLSSMDLLGITFGIFVQFAHCNILLFKLCTLEEIGWDIDEVKSRVNLADILDHTTQRIEHVPTLLALDRTPDIGNSSVFFKAPALIRAMKAIFVTAMTSSEVKRGHQLHDNADQATDFIDMPPIPDDMIMSLAEDPWMMDIFMQWF